MSLHAEIDGISDLQDSLDEMADGFDGSAQWRVYSDVHYAGYQEYGTAVLPPQPFFRPAVEHIASQDPADFADDPSSIDELVEAIALAIEAEAQENAPVDTGELRDSISAEEM